MVQNELHIGICTPKWASFYAKNICSNIFYISFKEFVGLFNEFLNAFIYFGKSMFN
jgi:hypothetical protein